MEAYLLLLFFNPRYICSRPEGDEKLRKWKYKLGYDYQSSVFCQTIAYLFNLSLVTSTVLLQWKEASIHPIPKTTAPKPEAYLHPISITAILERKYNGNETDIARFISFRFKFFRFRFVFFSYFLVSVSVSVNVNHTGTCSLSAWYKDCCMFVRASALPYTLFTRYLKKYLTDIHRMYTNDARLDTNIGTEMNSLKFALRGVTVVQIGSRLALL